MIWETADQGGTRYKIIRDQAIFQALEEGYQAYISAQSTARPSNLPNGIQVSAIFISDPSPGLKRPLFAFTD